MPSRRRSDEPVPWRAPRPPPRRAPRAAARRRRRAAASPPAAGGTSPRTALLAQRLVAAAARGALRRERAGAAARDAREADGRAEIHQRLRGGGAERVPGPLLDAATFTSTGSTSRAEREARDRVGGVAPDARQLGQVVRPAVRGDVLRRPVQVERAPVVAEPLPLADHVGRRGRRERLDRRPALEPALASAGRRARPASAGPSPPRRGSRTGPRAAATADRAKTPRTTPAAALPRRPA